MSAESVFEKFANGLMTGDAACRELRSIVRKKRVVDVNALNILCQTEYYNKSPLMAMRFMGHIPAFLQSHPEALIGLCNHSNLPLPRELAAMLTLKEVRTVRATARDVLLSRTAGRGTLSGYLTALRKTSNPPKDAIRRLEAVDAALAADPARRRLAPALLLAQATSDLPIETLPILLLTCDLACDLAEEGIADDKTQAAFSTALSRLELLDATAAAAARARAGACGLGEPADAPKCDFDRGWEGAEDDAASWGRVARACADRAEDADVRLVELLTKKLQSRDPYVPLCAVSEFIRASPAHYPTLAGLASADTVLGCAVSAVLSLPAPAVTEEAVAAAVAGDELAGARLAWAARTGVALPASVRQALAAQPLFAPSLAAAAGLSSSTLYAENQQLCTIGVVMDFIPALGRHKIAGPAHALFAALLQTADAPARALDGLVDDASALGAWPQALWLAARVRRDVYANLAVVLLALQLAEGVQGRGDGQVPATGGPAPVPAAEVSGIINGLWPHVEAAVELALAAASAPYALLDNVDYAFFNRALGTPLPPPLAPTALELAAGVTPRAVVGASASLTGASRAAAVGAPVHAHATTQGLWASTPRPAPAPAVALVLAGAAVLAGVLGRSGMVKRARAGLRACEPVVGVLGLGPGRVEVDVGRLVSAGDGKASAALLAAVSPLK